MPRRARPQPVVLGCERGSNLRELERSHDPTAVVRVHHRARGGIERCEPRMGDLGTLFVVEACPPFPRARLRSGRQRQVGQRRPQIQAGAADDDRRASRGEDLVDHRVGELRVLPDRGLMFERPDADEPSWMGSLVRQDRQIAIDLHRVGRHELRGDPFGHRFGDGRLAARGRPEDGDHRHRTILAAVLHPRARRRGDD